MLEKQVAWARDDGFDKIEVMAKRPRRALCHLYAGDNLEPFRIRVYYDTRRASNPQTITVGMKAEMNRLRLELLLSHPSP